MDNQNILGVFDSEDKLLSSIHKIREKNIKISDVISPYPIEKVFEELNLKTRLPVAAFIYGIIGLLGTFGFLYWTSVVNYPLVFGGKPQNTLSFIIVIFVMVIFTVVLFTLITFFIREKKGPGSKPYFEFPGIADDKFVIIINKADDTDVAQINKLLKEGGAIEVTEHKS